MRTLAVSLYKIANDIRLMSCARAPDLPNWKSQKTSQAPPSCPAR
jgi:aspartate ammonia-lyase